MSNAESGSNCYAIIVPCNMTYSTSSIVSYSCKICPTTSCTSSIATLPLSPIIPAVPPNTNATTNRRTICRRDTGGEIFKEGTTARMPLLRRLRRHHHVAARIIGNVFTDAKFIYRDRSTVIDDIAIDGKGRRWQNQQKAYKRQQAAGDRRQATGDRRQATGILGNYKIYFLYGASSYKTIVPYWPKRKTVFCNYTDACGSNISH